MCVCVSRCSSEKIYSTERRVHREELCKNCEPQLRNLWAPNFEERTRYETLQHERCARREAWDLTKNVYKLKKRGEMRSTLLPKPGNAGTFFEKARRVRIRDRFRSVDAHADQKGFKLRRSGNSPKIQEHHNNGNGLRKRSIRSRS